MGGQTFNGSFTPHLFQGTVKIHGLPLMRSDLQDNERHHWNEP